MSEANVEVIRNLIDAFNEAGGIKPTLLRFFDPDAVFEEPPEQPAPRVARGRDAVGELFGAFDATWAEHRSTPVEIRALDDDRVLLVSVEHFRGRDGIELDQPSAAIFTLRGRKIVRMQGFWDRERALEAAGLSE
jgi:ketosteroid isomerase-like protein